MTVGFQSTQQELRENNSHSRPTLLSGVINRTLGSNSPIRLKTTPLLTMRGIALLSFSIFLITGPVPEHSDLFAAVLGYSLLTLILLTGLATLLLGLHYRSKAFFQLTYDLRGSSANDPLASGRPTSHHPISLYLTVKGVTLIPFFSLRITPLFEHPFPSHAWKIIGSLLPTQELEQNLTFPHRGNWHIGRLQLVFKDTFGFSQFRWSIASDAYPTIEVFPRKTFSRNLPIYTAETTSGEEQTELHRTEGDPYDIKRYHPSDGVRRILWKVYAKSGELLSRHAEPSMTPEGLVALFVLAGKDDDELCSLALSHIRNLEEQDYDFYLSADGLLNLPPASRIDEVENLFLSEVWTANDCSNEQRKRALYAIENQFSLNHASKLQRITFFVSARRLISEKFLEEVINLQSHLAGQQQESLWIILDDRREELHPRTLPEQRWLNYFIAQDTKEQAEPDATEFDEAIGRITSVCEANRFPHIITR